MIHYTLDGSEPDATCSAYKGSIELSESTVVKAIVMRDGKPWMKMETEFKKDPEPRIRDPRWATVPQSKKFNGPFDKEIQGRWKERNGVFIFKSDGTLYRKGKDTPVAYWWYDFPNDLFENPDDAGTGELLWLNSKQKSKLTLTDQKAQKLEILTDENGNEPSSKNKTIDRSIFYAGCHPCARGSSVIEGKRSAVFAY